MLLDFSAPDIQIPYGTLKPTAIKEIRPGDIVCQSTDELFSFYPMIGPMHITGLKLVESVYSIIRQKDEEVTYVGINGKGLHNPDVELCYKRISTNPVYKLFFD